MNIKQNDDIINMVKSSTKIMEAYKYVIKNNPSNELPYHSIRHILNVFKAALNNKYLQKLSQIEVEALFVVILFHDYSHSGGKSDDTHNVTCAIKEFVSFAENYNKQTLSRGYSEYKIDFIYYVIRNIKATEYPYIIENEYLTFSQGIIRISDLLQVVYGNVLTDYILPLYDELIIRKNINMDLILFIDNCISFWEDAKFPFNDNEYETIRNNTIIEFKKYRKLLK